VIFGGAFQIVDHREGVHKRA